MEYCQTNIDEFRYNFHNLSALIDDIHEVEVILNLPSINCSALVTIFQVPECAFRNNDDLDDVYWFNPSVQYLLWVTWGDREEDLIQSVWDRAWALIVAEPRYALRFPTNLEEVLPIEEHWGCWAEGHDYTQGDDFGTWTIDDDLGQN
jgi:hypothetical protein